MTAEVEYVIGAKVSCQDDTCGRLDRVVVDPIKGDVTHLVVEPEHLHHGPGRLVPTELVASASPEEIRLDCDHAKFEALEPAEEVKFLPGAKGQWDYKDGEMLSWPYYGLGIGASFGVGLGEAGLGLSASREVGPALVKYDTVPADEVEVRRGQQVHATDGPIGHVEGLVVDPSDHHVSHVLLAEGHLFGHKEVTIPISAVTSVDGETHLSLSKEQVKNLPPVEVDRNI